MKYKFLNSAFNSAQFRTSMIRRWWFRKDVSLRFKFLNLLSGDRLRIACAIHALNVKEARSYMVLASEQNDKDRSEYYKDAAMCYANRAADTLEDIWKI